MDSALSPTRRVQRVRHELRRRELEVLQVLPLGPHFVSVTFGDASLSDFVSDSFDDHIKLIFNDAAGEPVRRDYTPRRFDRQAQTLTIEFALHGHGAASNWARQAAPGQRVMVGGPRGSMIVPTDYDWHLLAGDATALPAVHRRLEELPASTRAIVVLHSDDRRALHSAAALQLHWVDDADALVAVLRALPLPAGEGFVWCAGEATVMARLRDLMLLDKQHPREAMRVAAYWKRGASEFHETLTI
ncbi:MAG: siderophore-interacting protein [Rubrivivax sp.]